MAESCSICFLGAMDRLWFQQIILSSSSPSTALVFHSTFKIPEEPISETLSYLSPNISESPPLEEKISSAAPSDLTLSEDESNYQYDDDDEEEEEEEEEREVEPKERPTRINLTSSNYSSSVSPSNQIHPKRLRSFPSSGSATRLQKTMSCRSLSELELEEVKGFMDLGFKFSKEHVSPRMMSVLPGLQRLGICEMNEQIIRSGLSDNEIRGEGEEEEKQESGVRRPYLSEAWLIRRPDSPLPNLRLPRASAAADMKKHLRSWARTVASVIQKDS